MVSSSFIADAAPLVAPPPPGPPASPRAAEPARTSTPLRLRYDVNSLDNRDPWFMEQVVRVVETLMLPYHRAEVHGLERIPEGAALYVGNHNGGSMAIDSFIFGAALFRAHGLEGCPHVLAHDFALAMPGLHHVFTKIGAVRASHENARRLFAAGKKVMVYPGGAEEALRPFRDRDRIRFFGHRGDIRTALANDVPVIPVVGQGGHSIFMVLDDARWVTKLLGIDRLWRVKSWGVTLSVPWGLTLFPPPLYLPLPAKIRVEVLDPIRFDRAGAEAAADDEYVAACARLVEERMQQALSRLARA